MRPPLRSVRFQAVLLISTCALIALALVGVLSGGHPARAEEPTPVPADVPAELVHMDRDITKALGAVQDGDTHKVGALLSVIAGDKADLISLFPPIFGLPAGQVVGPLMAVDRSLTSALFDASKGDMAHAQSFVESAKRYKELLEKLIAKAFSSNLAIPADVPAELVHMDRDITKALGAVQDGDTHKVGALLSVIAGDKADLISLFPPIFGLPAGQVVGPLMAVDRSLTSALFDASKGDMAHAQSFVESAKRYKELLEKLIARVGTTGAPSPTTTTTTTIGPTISTTSSSSTTSSTTSSTSTTSTTLQVAGTLGATFNWAFFDPTEVQGSGMFTQSPAGSNLTAVKVVVPPAGSTARSITNTLCPSQLPNGSLSTTTNPNDTLTCSGGSLAVGTSFSLNVQTSPSPSSGMGGQLFGQQNGSFAGPFTIGGP